MGTGSNCDDDASAVDVVDVIVGCPVLLLSVQSGDSMATFTRANHFNDIRRNVHELIENGREAQLIVDSQGDYYIFTSEGVAYLQQFVALVKLLKVNNCSLLQVVSKNEDSYVSSLVQLKLGDLPDISDVDIFDCIRRQTTNSHRHRTNSLSVQFCDPAESIDYSRPRLKSVPKAAPAFLRSQFKPKPKHLKSPCRKNSKSGTYFTENVCCASSGNGLAHSRKESSSNAHPDCQVTPQQKNSAVSLVGALAASGTVGTTASNSLSNVAAASSDPTEQTISKAVNDLSLDTADKQNTITARESLPQAVGANGAGSSASTTCDPSGAAGDSESDIEAALRNEGEARKFLDFLNQQYCSENFYFYLSVQKYKELAPNDVEGRYTLGNQIFERHFAPNCNEPVNVEYATNKAIVDAKRSNEFKPDTYDHAQYQIFHLLKYDVWPRYMRAEMEKRSSRGCGDNDVSSEHTETSSCGEGHKALSKRPSMREVRQCMVLSADSLSSEKEILNDPLISVKRWTETMAQRRGMDKNSTEVVDAQTGSTIDPARQAIDALNNRHVRLMPVVRFPVDFLAPTALSKNCSPMPVKVVMLRVRQGLTLMKVLRPLLIKYNFDPNDIMACFAGTCEPIPLSTTVACITPRMVTVMTHQQFKDRKLLPKREYQKELAASPILNQNQEMNFPYFQHGDIAFYELPTEGDAKGQKHNATRSHSTNPRELFKFGRKASQAKSKSDNEGNPSTAAPAHDSSNKSLQHPASMIDRRKSVGTSGNRQAAPTPSMVAASDIPYCGEASLSHDDLGDAPRTTSQKTSTLRKTPSAKSQQPPSKEPPKASPVRGTAAAPATVTFSEGPFVAPKGCFDMPDFIRGNAGRKGSNENVLRVPAIYASAVRSDKEASSPSEGGLDKISWYADYV